MHKTHKILCVVYAVGFKHHIFSSECPVRYRGMAQMPLMRCARIVVNVHSANALVAQLMSSA